MMLLVKCPKCKHNMKYQASTMVLTGKRKSCVYCGRNFSVREALIKRLK